MARYLLIVNDQYYPSVGTDDWKGTFSSEESAEEVGKKSTAGAYSQKSYDVIDLQEWLDLDPIKT